jgi:hypothetical protein
MIWVLSFSALVLLALTALILASAEMQDDNIDNIVDELYDELEPGP